jgi:hypothetical protein
VAKRKAAAVEETEDGAPKSVVETAKERYERAKTFYDTPRILAIEDTRFVMGDSDNMWQWPAEVYQDRANISRKPCLTVNATAQHCNQIINNIRQNRPSAKVVPVDDFSDVETAKILGGMLRSIQAVSNADTAHDLAAEHALYGGEGYWRVITEYDDYKSFDQVIRIKSIANPFLVYIDPDAKEPDRSDARWGFVFEDISKQQCKEDHPDIDPQSWVEDVRRGWVNQDTVRRAEYFWCDYIPDKLYLLSDGTTILKSELDEQGGEVQDQLITFEGQPVPGLEVVFERDTKRKQWKWCKLLGGEEKPIDERDWPGSYLPIITVVGKELNVNGEIVRKGVVRDLKDPARMLNYSYSAAVETIALQNKIPYMASVEAIEGFEDIYGAANIDSRAYLPYNAFDENGNALEKPERQAPATMPTAQVQMLQLSTEQMRAASGQQNANFGIKSEAQSGVGIQRLKAQGEIATFHFPDNLARALKYEATVVLDLIPKVSERKQIIRILGLDGKEGAAMLDPNMEQAFAEIEAKVDKVFNPGVGKYDVAIDTGPSYQTQRQEAQAFVGEVIARDPGAMSVVGDLVWQTQDMPLSQEFAERYKKLPSIAALQDQKGKSPIPPEVQAALQQMQEQMAAMQEAGAELQTRNQELELENKNHEQENTIRMREVEVRMYDAETKRIAALNPPSTGLTPEQAQFLVVETLRQMTPGMPTPPADPGAIQEMTEQEQTQGMEYGQQTGTDTGGGGD